MLATFDPENVIFTINDYQLTDFALGEFITLRLDAPKFRKVSGIRGKNTRVHTRDRSGTVSFRMLQTSNQNNILSQITNSDDFNLSNKLMVNIVDVGGGTGIQVGNAYLESVPNISFSSDTTPNDWVINFEYITRYDVGGNQKGALDFIGNLF